MAQGAENYTKYCALCHGADGEGYAADNAPSLITQTFLESANDSYFLQTVKMGRTGTAMGGYTKSRGGPMTDPEITNILTFLRTKGPAQVNLPGGPVTGDRDKGFALYEETCKECHGTPEARGEAPVLANGEFLQYASDSFIKYNIVKGRAGTKMPPFGEKLKDEEINDIVAYIRGLAPAVATPRLADTAMIPNDLPMILNPKGDAPSFTLRDDRFVPAEQVNQALKEKKRIVILDARTPSEWVKLRIPGAVPVPYHEFTRLDAIPNDGTWVVAYCACPHHASGAVVDELKKRGYKNAVVLDEGILVWKQRGYPIEGETANAGPDASSSAAISRGGAPLRKALPPSTLTKKPIPNNVPFGPPPPPK